MDNQKRALVKCAQMLALHNKYVKAMEAGKAELRKIAAAEMRKRAMYRKVYVGLKGMRKGAGR